MQANNFKSANIINSYRLLKGNARTTIIFEPLWGIPFAMYNFYLSLYMKSQGVTDMQIGFIICISFISGAVFAILGGAVTDALGRKKTTLIFDLICWPGAVLIYLVANNFWIFAIGAVVNSSVRIVAISWNLIMIEDADNEQMITAYNLHNIIYISTGILTPLGGLLVKQMGVASAERIFLAFSAVSMTVMMLLRNRYYTETSIGQQILDSHPKLQLGGIIRKSFQFKNAFRTLAEKPGAVLVLCIFVLFNTYIPIGSHLSLYFVPYLTDVLKIEKATISIIGGINSAVMLVIFVLVIPIISRYNKLKNMIAGLSIQVVSLIILLSIPSGSFSSIVAYIVVFATGFSIFRPFVDSAFAEYTEGSGRAGVYSLLHTLTALFSASVGLVSGYLYTLNPDLLYVVSVVILLVCIIMLVILLKKMHVSGSEKTKECIKL